MLRGLVDVNYKLVLAKGICHVPLQLLTCDMSLKGLQGWNKVLCPPEKLVEWVFR